MQNEYQNDQHPNHILKNIDSPAIKEKAHAFYKNTHLTAVNLNIYIKDTCTKNVTNNA